MTWIKLEDTLPDHERALRAGSRAMWLYVSGTCYCSRHLTDGRIPAVAVRQLVTDKDAAKLAEALVDVGLWVRDGDGYEVRNYAKFQRTAEEVEAERESTRKRVRKFREKRSGNGVTNGDVTLPDKRRVDTDSPQPPRGHRSTISYCERCGLPEDAPGDTPRCECESNVVELARGGVAS